MKYNKHYEVLKTLSSIYPRSTIGEASKKISEGVLIEKYQYKNLQKRSNNLQAIA
jgi:hypothetical protein